MLLKTVPRMRQKFRFLFLVFLMCSVLTLTFSAHVQNVINAIAFGGFTLRRVSPNWLHMTHTHEHGSMNTTEESPDPGTSLLRMKYSVINKDIIKRPLQFPEIEYKEKQVSISSSLNDFKKYPCLAGLPMFPQENWATDGKCVRTVNTTETGDQSAKHCVPLKFRQVTTPICIYPAKQDKWVSARLEETGQWEGDLVEDLALLLKSKSDIEFLDLGCNIEVYSLSIALQGTKVTAIDAMTQNLQLLSQSLTLGNLHENVTLIWNAVSNTHKIVKFKPDRGNIGGTRIEDFIFSPSIRSDEDLARTIILDDLLPLFKDKRIVIKMDIENSEYNALLGGSRFLDEVHIIAIQMEFCFHKNGQVGPNIVAFMSSKGFRPYRDLSKKVHLNSLPLSAWPGDIYFMGP